MLGNLSIACAIPRAAVQKRLQSTLSRPLSLRSLRQDGHAADSRLLRACILAKPGAGKGTLTSRLVKKYDIETFSTGDLLRKHILERTPIGLEAEEIVAHGGLVPDEIMLQVVSSELDSLQGKHWILDGFPRTLQQGVLLDVHLERLGAPLSLIVNVDVPDEVILSRISDRWVHLPSGRVYNMSYNRPKVVGLDDETGEPLTKRPDDNPEIFGRRLTKFYSATSPLLDYYSASARRVVDENNGHQHPHQLAFPSPPGLRLECLTGSTSDEIWPKLEAAVTKAFPSLKERPQSIEKKRRHSLSDAVLSQPLTTASVA